MINQEDLNYLIQNGGAVNDRDGERIGTVGRFYVPDGTGQVGWVTVAPALFASSETFIPLDGAWLDGLAVFVAYSKEAVEAAPRQNRDGELSAEEARELLAHYGAP
ncbi:MAG TPA: PRC-barrel domain-containing protein [Micrococcaceae bacterium]|jgi:hypothetical protein